LTVIILVDERYIRSSKALNNMRKMSQKVGGKSFNQDLKTFFAARKKFVLKKFMYFYVDDKAHYPTGKLMST
jgi:hypothetical protein